jgi:crotonobetaine/carnitine-CoA ligase
VIDRDKVLPHRIATLADERPDETAMLDVAGRSLTWSQLQTEFQRWAGALRAVGVATGDHVVTMLPNSFEAYLAWLGTSWLRALEVPANNMYRGETLRYLIENSQARTVVIAQRYVDRLTLVADDLNLLETVVVPDAEGELPELPFRVVRGDDFLAAEPASDLPGPDYYDVAAMIYTSGTTGPSKGVLVPWGELYQSPLILPADLIGDREPYYAVSPAFHLSGKISLYNAAIPGGYLVIRESFSPSEYWNDIRQHNVRGGALLGPMAAILLMMPPQEDDADNPLESLMMGPMLPNIEEFKQRFGVKRVCSGYGMTEIGFPLTTGWDPPNPRTCGKRREGAPFYEVRVVNEHDEPVEAGTVGELIVRAGDPWVMNQGYWAMPEATSKAWRNGWFHTGDAFVEDEDGWLYFVDRRKDALRRRGENISSFEVEAGINAHPEVAETAVLGVPSELTEDDVLAVIVRTPGSDLTAEVLVEWLIPRMPRFHIPRYIEFIDELPKTDGTFRVQKYVLREKGVTAQTWDREAAGIVLPKD